LKNTLSVWKKNYKKSPIFLLLQNTIFQIWKDR